MDRDLRQVEKARFAVSLIAFTLAYTTLAYVGLNWAQVRGAGSPIWPAAGLGIAILMLGGVRLWPAIFVGRLAAAVLSVSPQPLWADTLIAAGNTLATIIPALLLARMGGQEFTLRLLGSFLRFCLLGGVVQALIAAAIGTAVLALSAGLDVESAFGMFANWSIGAFVGAVTIGPLILAWHDNPGGFTLRRLIAFAALMAAVAVFAWSVFASSEIDNLRTWHILPMLVVASLTFGARGASTALLIIAAIAVWGTNAGVGQFNQMSVSPEQRMMLLQQFIGTITLTALILSVVTDERRMKDILAARQEFLRKAEQESRARAEELEVILGAVPVAVVIAHDPECRKMSTNQVGANALRIGPLLHFDRESSPYVRMLDATGRELPLGERPMHRAARGETLTDFAGKVVFDDGSTRDFLGAARPLHDAHGAVRGAVGAFLDTTERKKAEERITLLAREVDHRAKNVMAVVQAMARLTKADDIDSFRKAILGRIGNLARTHNLLAANLWEGVSFADLIRDEFAAYGLNGNESGGTGTLDAAGPDLQLHPGMAQSLALVIHELITNAIKYGALSVPAGQVGVEWRIEGDGDENLLLVDWREHNGPPVSPPQQPGFGSELMAGAIRHQLGGELDMDWSLAGLCVALRVPLRHQDPE